MQSHELHALAIFSQIADLKENDYKNTLAVTALIELLIEKNLITPQELRRRVDCLESEAEEELSLITQADDKPL